MIICQLFENCSQVFIKFATTYKVAPLDLALVRMMLNFLIASFMVLRSGDSIRVDRKDISTLGNRIFFGYACYTLQIYCFSVLPVGFVQTLIATGPFFAAIIGFMLLNEGLSRTELLCMLGCFFGIVALSLAKPKDSMSSDDQAHLVDPVAYLSGILVGIFCAFSFAIIGITTRMMKDLSMNMIQFHYGWTCTLFSLLLLLLQKVFGLGETGLFGYPAEAWWFMIGSGVFNAVGMYFSGIAMQLERTAFIQAIAYIGVCFGFTCDVTIFGFVPNII